MHHREDALAVVLASGLEAGAQFAEKLARDLYDLPWFASRPFDEALVRRLTVLKVWHDVIDDGLGDAPFAAEHVLRQRMQREFQPEAIGYLTTPVDIPRWVTAVVTRFAFLRDLDDLEQRVARCSRGDEWQVRQVVAGLRPSVGGAIISLASRPLSATRPSPCLPTGSSALTRTTR